jgi:proline iminopeptidase
MTDFLTVTDGHALYFEQSGNPSGVPAVFLHGGPGSGTSPKQRRFFDPSVYRIILFDQRGAGRSLPFASLENNTTWKLVEDLEALREFLGIDRWLVFGGSWGSTLALSYATTHPERVSALVLRGIFLIRPEEIRFFYQEGSSWLFPDAWEDFLKPIPLAERGDLVRAYHRRLTSDDALVRASACAAWSIWEGRTSKLLMDPDVVAQFSGDRFAESLARIESHFFVNDGFFDFAGENYLLHPSRINKIRSIPTVIVQGRYDVVCPMKSAWDLHVAFPEADFRVVPDSGHSAFDVGIQKELLDATDRFRGAR